MGMDNFSLEDFLLKTKVEQERLQPFISDDENNPLPKRDVFWELKNSAEDFFHHRSTARMFGLSGLRGVGKTTLMWQLAKEIYDNYTQDIYFFELESFIQLFGETKLYPLCYKFEEIVLRRKFYSLDKPIVFLFDEVHAAENWSMGLKILYDQCPRAFVIATGSAALMLDSNTDLVTRWNILHIFPYKFSEYLRVKTFRKWQSYLKHLNWILDIQKKKLISEPLSDAVKTLIENGVKIYQESINDVQQKKMVYYKEINSNDYYKNLEYKLSKILFFSKNIEEVNSQIEKLKIEILDFFSKIKDPWINKLEDNFKSLQIDFINHHNIPRFLSIDNSEKIYEGASDTFEKILQLDIPKWQKHNPHDNIVLNARKLLTRLSFAHEMQIEKLCSDSGCKKEEVEFIIDLLKKAEVLIEFSYFGNINSKLNKKGKIYFMSPTLRLALREKYERSDITSTLQGLLNEEMVALYLKRLFSEGDVFVLNSQNGNKNVDFVIETRKESDDRFILLEVKKSKRYFTNLPK